MQSGLPAPNYILQTQQTKELHATVLRRTLISYQATALRLAAQLYDFSRFNTRRYGVCMDENDIALCQECHDTLKRPPAALSATASELQSALGGYEKIQGRFAAVPLSSFSSSSAQRQEPNTVEAFTVKEESDDDSGFHALTSDNGVPYRAPSRLLTKPLLWRPHDREDYAHRYPPVTPQRHAHTLPPANHKYVNPATSDASRSTYSSNGTCSQESPPRLIAQRKIQKRACRDDDTDEDKRPSTKVRSEPESADSPPVRTRAKKSPSKRANERAAASPVARLMGYLQTPHSPGSQWSTSTLSSRSTSPVSDTATGLSPTSLCTGPVERSSKKRARNSDEDIEGVADDEERPSTRVKIESDSDNEAFNSFSAGTRRTQEMIGEKLAAARASARAPLSHLRRRGSKKEVTNKLRRDSFGEIPGLGKPPKHVVTEVVRRSERLRQKTGARETS